MSHHLNVYFPKNSGVFEAFKVEADMFGTELRKVIFEWLQSDGYKGRLKDFRMPGENILVREPQNPLKDRILQWLHRQADLPLFAAEDEVSDHFGSGPSKKLIHLVIVDDEIMEAVDVLGDLDARYRQELKRASEKLRQPLEKLPSPSSLIGNATHIQNHLSDSQQSIYIDQVPAALFNPQIAQLQSNLQNLDSIDLSTFDLDRAATLFKQLVQCHSNEDTLDKITRTALEKLLGNVTFQESLSWAQDIKPAGHIKEGIFFPLFLEEKVINGNSGDPVLQAIIDYAKVVAASKFKKWRDITNFPIVLLGIAGHRIEIAIAVNVGPIYASRIFICDISKGFRQYNNCLKLARAFKVLRVCIDSLRNYYRTLPINLPTILYPNPTSVVHGQLPNLTFQGIISPAGQVSPNPTNFHLYGTALYLAKRNEKEVIVKFTSQYNAEAHRLLASAGYAPELFECIRVVGGLYMVVMERVFGESVWALVSRNAFPPVIGDEVEKAIEILHRFCFVFGDLRNPNIMYVGAKAVNGVETQKERVLLIDFDWAGEAGRDRYPPILNPTLEWAPGVEPFGIMEQEHDLFHVERIKKIGRP